MKTTEFLYSSRFFVVLSLFLFTMIIALTVAQVRERQDVRSSAAGDLKNCTVSGFANDSEEKKALNLINGFRKQNNLEPLKFQDDLNRAATWKSEDMAKTHKLSHTDSRGRGVVERFPDCGYKPFSVIKENITDVAVTGQEAFTAWKNSPPHREAMLCKDCEDIGLARADTTVKNQGNNKGGGSKKIWYWTMTAGALQATTPSSEPTGSGSTTTPSPTSGNAATNTPTPEGTTVTITPSGPLAPGSSAIGLTVIIPGIGKDGNNNPKHPDRSLTITLSDKNNKAVGDLNETIHFNTSSGSFDGTVALPQDLPTGDYFVKVKTDNSIARIISSGLLTLQRNTINNLPDVMLPTIDLDNNNEISFADVKVFQTCFAGKTCTDPKLDLNDDGQINLLDYNVFRDVFGNYQGE